MDHHTLFWLASQFPPIAIVWASLLGFVPTFAALVAIVWYGILIWESKTAQQWRSRHHLRRLKKVEAERTMLLGLLKEEHSETPEDKSAA